MYAKVMKWDDDDAITHNCLSMCNDIMAANDVFGLGEVICRWCFVLKHVHRMLRREHLWNLYVLQREHYSSLVMFGCEGAHTKLYFQYLRGLHDTFGSRVVYLTGLVVLNNSRHKLNLTYTGLRHRKWNFRNVKMFWNMILICFNFVWLQVIGQNIVLTKEGKLLVTVIQIYRKRKSSTMHSEGGVKNYSW
jgi:hypothetical protein